MTNTWNKLTFAAVLLLTLLVAGSMARGALGDGGALEPGGPPAPGMKSLQEVEPRTPISSLPYTITTSGSYYLTQNLFMSLDVDGITVTAEDVTIDLNGFRLTGPSSGSSADGITAFGFSRLTVRNGTVRDWPLRGIVHSGQEARFENLQLAGNFVGLTVDSTSIVRNVNAGGNATGISVLGNGSTVSGTVAANNSSAAIFVLGGYNRIEDNNTIANSSGIVVTGSNNLIIHNSATANGTEFNVFAGNFAPIETSPTVTNPWANIVY